MIKLAYYTFNENVRGTSLPVYVDVYKVNDFVIAFVDHQNDEVWFCMETGYDLCCGYGWIFSQYDMSSDSSRPDWKLTHAFAAPPRLIDLYNHIQSKIDGEELSVLETHNTKNNLDHWELKTPFGSVYIHETCVEVDHKHSKVEIAFFIDEMLLPNNFIKQLDRAMRDGVVFVLKKHKGLFAGTVLHVVFSECHFTASPSKHITYRGGFIVKTGGLTE